MGRKRIPMEVIQKEKARKTTFQKRKAGLIKKVYEFSTLCGVDVCAIIDASDFDITEPETWPSDPSEVHRIIQKFYNTASDRRPKIYNVQEYNKDRTKKVEAEVSKVRKERLKKVYPTWDDSYNVLGQEQLRFLASTLGDRFNICIQILNLRKRDPKGKAIAESETFSAYLASDPSGQLNLMDNMSKAQLFPFPMNMKSVSDENQLALYPFQLGQSSQPSGIDFGQNGMVDWANQAGVVTCDSKTDVLNQYGAENNQNSLPFYYNGNIQTMHPYSIALQALPSQNLQDESAFLTQSDLPPGFQLNGFYDTNTLSTHMFNHMHGRK